MSATIPKATYQSVEALTRWASRVPDFTVTSTVPAHGATNIPVNQTINIVFPIAIDATTANSTNNTLHTVTVTTAVRGLFGDAKVPFPAPFVFSFTTAP